MDYFIGQIKTFPYGFEPEGWVLCDGRTLQIQDNTALFSLIGNRFGGDGQITFNLPYLSQAEPDSARNGQCHYYIALTGLYPSRS